MLLSHKKTRAALLWQQISPIKHLLILKYRLLMKALASWLVFPFQSCQNAYFYTGPCFNHHKFAFYGWHEELLMDIVSILGLVPITMIIVQMFLALMGSQLYFEKSSVSR